MDYIYIEVISLLFRVSFRFFFLFCDILTSEVIAKQHGNFFFQNLKTFVFQILKTVLKRRGGRICHHISFPHTSIISVWLFFTLRKLHFLKRQMNNNIVALFKTNTKWFLLGNIFVKLNRLSIKRNYYTITI